MIEFAYIALGLAWVVIFIATPFMAYRDVLEDDKEDDDKTNPSEK